MLTRLRNANSAYHDDVEMPFSKIKSHIAEILQQAADFYKRKLKAAPTAIEYLKGLS